MTEWFDVTTIGDQDLILGLPWLEKHNPIINWKEKTLLDYELHSICVVVGLVSTLCVC